MKVGNLSDAISIQNLSGPRLYDELMRRQPIDFSNLLQTYSYTITDSSTLPDDWRPSQQLMNDLDGRYRNNPK